MGGGSHECSFVRRNITPYDVLHAVVTCVSKQYSNYVCRLENLSSASALISGFFCQRVEALMTMPH